MITRDQAWELLKKYNKEPFHQHHAVTVEGVMRYYAQKKGYDPEFWGLCGLLHDVDFEMWPEEHCQKAPELLAEIDTPEEIVHAVCSHGYGICSDVEPTHEMEKFLFASDELTGLIFACAMARPSKSVTDMEVKSVTKKFKALNFAAACNREVIKAGAELMGVELNDVIQDCILAMRTKHEEIGC